MQVACNPIRAACRLQYSKCVYKYTLVNLYIVLTGPVLISLCTTLATVTSHSGTHASLRMTVTAPSSSTIQRDRSG